MLINYIHVYYRTMGKMNYIGSYIVGLYIHYSQKVTNHFVF